MYYDETADQYDQFEDYENNYYSNSQFQQKNSWVNYTIDEDWAFSEAYEEASEVNENIDTNHVIEQASYHCCQYSEFFSSNNDLYKHVRSSHNLSNIKASQALTSEPELKSVYFTILNEKLNKELVQSNTTAVSVKGYEFQEWYYITVQVKLSQNRQIVFICLNTDCTVSLIDWDFLNEHAPTAEVKRMTSSMKVWGLSFSLHAAEDYIELNLFFSADHSKTAVIHCEIHIIDDLKANVLIETDILISEKIDILLSQWKIIVGSCQNVQLDLNITTLSNQTNQLLLLNDQTTISIYDSIIVQIKPLQELLTDCNLLFKSECKLADIYISIVNHTVISIEV